METVTVFQKLIDKANLCRTAASQANCEWMRRTWIVKAVYLEQLAKALPINQAERIA